MKAPERTPLEDLVPATKAWEPPCSEGAWICKGGQLPAVGPDPFWARNLEVSSPFQGTINLGDVLRGVGQQGQTIQHLTGAMDHFCSENPSETLCSNHFYFVAAGCLLLSPVCYFLSLSLSLSPSVAGTDRDTNSSTRQRKTERPRLTLKPGLTETKKKNKKTNWLDC